MRVDGKVIDPTSPISVDARSMDMTAGALYTSLSDEARREVVFVASEVADMFEARLERPARLGSRVERGIVPPRELDDGEMMDQLKLLSDRERV